jgi:hypothetical protein
MRVSEYTRKDEGMLQQASNNLQRTWLDWTYLLVRAERERKRLDTAASHGPNVLSVLG